MAATNIWVSTNLLTEMSGSAATTQPLQASFNESFAVEFFVETVGIEVRYRNVPLRSLRFEALTDYTC